MKQYHAEIFESTVGVIEPDISLDNLIAHAQKIKERALKLAAQEFPDDLADREIEIILTDGYEPYAHDVVLKVGPSPSEELKAKEKHEQAKINRDKQVQRDLDKKNRQKLARKRQKNNRKNRDKLKDDSSS